ncbi:outer membrane protein assembly factor BamE [Colwellia sp. E2M01]|uniref:outer membrane protein assembly factor BamE n=1 Tax=Colwellia sp. E2M01 TaxID=2841561 RepID=UPI001C09389B|nr:outer membrane protein assembly factor BamE [Colwellia sp. E2M01]MBU2871631.1 outer membrane protein assembly factor BamE [Colwellia sp. E2M01]
MKKFKLKNSINTAVLSLLASSLVACMSTSETSSAPQDPNFTEGAKVVALVNIHADYANNRLYALNYQMSNLIPMCSEFVIKDIDDKEIEISYQGKTYNYLWDKHTRSAGQSLEQNFKTFFGERCDSDKVAQLSAIDQEGIEKGTPLLGMSKEGITYAMGKPPMHATPSLDNNSWTYWVNRWSRNILKFDNEGKLESIIK